MMDIEQAKRGAIAIHGPMFHKVSPRIQNLLIEMVFQLGEDTARTFRRFNAALAEGDYDQAARELVSSRWYKQTPNRVRSVNSSVAVVKSSPPTTVVRLAMPVLDSLLIHPEGEGTTFYQGQVVQFPVADLLFGLPHLTLQVG